MEPRRPRIYLPPDDSALLAQCVMTTFRSSGAGGQHVNTTDSAVRLHHLPSDIVVTDQSTRSQHRNRANCIRKLREEVARRNYRPPPRKPSKPSKSAVRRSKEAKARHAAKKADRKFRPDP